MSAVSLRSVTPQAAAELSAVYHGFTYVYPSDRTQRWELWKDGKFYVRLTGHNGRYIEPGMLAARIASLHARHLRMAATLVKNAIDRDLEKRAVKWKKQWNDAAYAAEHGEAGFMARKHGDALKPTANWTRDDVLKHIKQNPDLIAALEDMDVVEIHKAQGNA